jgi:hypothetical protein
MLQRRLRKLGTKLPESCPWRIAGARVVTLVEVMCANAMFHAKTIGGAPLIMWRMFGLRGVSRDLAVGGVGVVVAILICTAIVAFFANTQRIMSRFHPAYNWNECHDVSPSLVSRVWKPNDIGFIAAGVVLFFGVIFVERGEVIFPYFKF